VGNRKEGAGMKTILFSTPMVQAILAGRKTQTRRIVKPQPKHEVVKIWTDTQDPIQYHFQSPWAGTPCDGIHVSGTVAKPRYERGDILWVRETWGISNFDVEDYSVNIVYKADEKEVGYEIVFPDEKFTKLYNSMTAMSPDWRPSIHMPKEAARIFLKVTGVRVERLQEITEEDARAEGCKPLLNGGGFVVISARGKFHVLWDSINLKRWYGWDTSPWVWVIEFERTEEK
jgi:hypothetical protein